ncbi:MAG: 50S ribosome-binding GTPase [Phycisphaerae bacterium]|nr:50S ribosome-binding GTPase [Phycisphaerae bacterium]
MPVNQTPEYMKAEERYRAATTPQKRLEGLEEMLRLLPKHKGSEKLQSQLKQRIKVARQELQQPKRHGGGHRDLFSVPKQGAGQVTLLGEANVGKSAIVHALTDAKVEVADFPFATHAAVPGMAHHEDVPIQFVDMPPVIKGQAQPGMMGAFRAADIILLVVDLSAIGLLDQFEQPISMLLGRNLRPVSQPVLEFDTDEPDVEPKRVLVAANKCDTPGALDNFEGMKELLDSHLWMLPISAETGEGLTALTAACFELLHVIRIYSKKPGKPVDYSVPFIMPMGGTVQDLAYLVHRDLAANLKSARAWGSGVHDGQQVNHTHVLTDKDVVELHF